MNTQYLRDVYQDEYKKNLIKKGLEYLLELNNIKETDIKKEDIITMFINMSSQSNGILDLKKSIKIINKPVQIYLHRLDKIEKFLEPIILTKEKLNKITFILSQSSLEGYTKYSFLETWIIKNDIKNFVIFD